jgi:hypothetical protein
MVDDKDIFWSDLRLRNGNVCRKDEKKMIVAADADAVVTKMKLQMHERA